MVVWDGNECVGDIVSLVVLVIMLYVIGNALACL